MEELTKVCSKCREEKNINDFDLRKDTNTHKGTCKECRRVFQRSYSETNRDIIRQKHKTWRDDNKEKIKGYDMSFKDKNPNYHKLYYEENKEHILFRQENWRNNNRDYLKDASKVNREYHTIRHKKWVEENRNHLLLYTDEWRAKNKELIEKWNKNQRELLPNCIVNGMIASQFKGSIISSDIPQEITELKRNSIILKRIIKSKIK